MMPTIGNMRKLRVKSIKVHIFSDAPKFVYLYGTLADGDVLRLELTKIVFRRLGGQVHLALGREASASAKRIASRSKSHTGSSRRKPAQ